MVNTTSSTSIQAQGKLDSEGLGRPQVMRCTTTCKSKRGHRRNSGNTVATLPAERPDIFRVAHSSIIATSLAATGTEICFLPPSTPPTVAPFILAPPGYVEARLLNECLKAPQPCTPGTGPSQTLLLELRPQGSTYGQLWGFSPQQALKTFRPKLSGKRSFSPLQDQQRMWIRLSVPVLLCRF